MCVCVYVCVCVLNFWAVCSQLNNGHEKNVNPQTLWYCICRGSD